MNDKMQSVLNALNDAAKAERSGMVKTSPSESMSAITWDTGVFFNIMLQSMGAKNVLEIGTSTGFSTIWMAEAVSGRDGSVITVEMSTKKIERARQNLSDAGIAEIVHIWQGVALDVLATMTASGKYDDFFDFVLIDADKENILSYFESSMQLVKSGGIIAVDNMLLPEKFAPIMNNFAQRLRKNPAVRAVTLPVGNGEEIILKL